MPACPPFSSPSQMSLTQFLPSKDSKSSWRIARGRRMVLKPSIDLKAKEYSKENTV